MSLEAPHVLKDRVIRTAVVAVAVSAGTVLGAEIVKEFQSSRKLRNKTSKPIKNENEVNIVNSSHSGEASQLIFSAEYPNH